MIKDPWNFSEVKDGDLCEDCRWLSPNKKFTLKYSNVKEILNNYPLTGNCYFKSEEEEVLLHIDAGGPPVWSQDSKYFAVPVWLYNEQGYVQRIGFGSIEDMTFKISTNFFKVMQLVSVDAESIKIIENPAKEKLEKPLKTDELDFYETIHLPDFIETLQ